MQFQVRVVIAREAGMARDLHPLPGELLHADREMTIQLRDPALSPLIERLVIHGREVQEHFAIGHEFSHHGFCRRDGRCGEGPARNGCQQTLISGGGRRNTDWHSRGSGGVQVTAKISQIDEQIRRGLEATGDILLEQFADDAFQFGGHVVVEAGNGFGLVVDDALNGVANIGSGKWQTFGQHLVEHDAEAEQIAAVIHLPADRLLGAHVVGRPQNLSGLGLMLGRDVGFRRGFFRHEFGEAKIQNLDQAAIADADIGRLEIAMDHAPTEGGVKGVGDLDRNIHDVANRERFHAGAPVQRGALEELHRQIGPAVGGLSDFMNDADVGMVQRGRGAGFREKALTALAVLNPGHRQQLERNLATEPAILGEKYFAHPARAERLEDGVMGDHFRHARFGYPFAQPGANSGGVGGKPCHVIFRHQRRAAFFEEFPFDEEQFLEQRGSRGWLDCSKVIFNPRLLPRAPGGLKRVAHGVDLFAFSIGGFVARRHEFSSPFQSSRMRSTLRSMLRRVMPSFPAISCPVQPSIFHKAMLRSVSSSSASSRRRCSSAS